LYYIEWWDPKWIQDNITRKLDIIDRQTSGSEKLSLIENGKMPYSRFESRLGFTDVFFAKDE